MNYYVYVHTSPNGKVYVGKTTLKPEDRWQRGRGYGYNEYFTRAIEKYGWDNFKHDVVECSDEEQMNDLEMLLIAHFDSTNPENGYNHSIGGEGGSRGSHMSEETRKRMSVVKSGELNPMYGNHHSEESRRKMSESHKGKPKSEEHRRNLSKSQKGRYHSEETRKKISIANSGELNPMHGKHHSEDTRRKMSIPICQLTKDGVLIREWSGITEAGNALGINKGDITTCCKGRQKSAGGYRWCYKD